MVVTRLGAAVVLLALLCLSPLVAVAQGAADDEVLVVGGDAHYPPFQFLDERGRPAGFDVELVRLLAQNMGVEVRFELGDWGESLERLDRGEVDLVPMFASSGREQRFLFSKPYLLRYHAVFGPKDRAPMESLDELAGRSVAVQRRSMAWESLRALDGEPVRLVELDTEGQVLPAVARGEAEYGLLPTGVGYQVINDQRLGDLVALSAPLLERRYVLAVNRTRPDLVVRMNAGLDQLRTSGAQDRLYVKWIGNLAGRRGGDWMLPALGGGLAMIAALAALALVLSRRSSRAPARDPRRVGRGGGRPATGMLGGLLDRAGILEHMDACARRWQPGSPGFAVADVRLLDLDVVRDLADDGRAQQAVAIVGGRLAAEYGRNEVAYLGPGRFGVLLHDIEGTAASCAAMERIATLVSQRISVGALPVDLRSRIGSAIFPDDGADPEALARSARLACDAAERRGVPQLPYHVDLEPDPRNLTLLVELREALASGQLGYELQPKMSLHTRHWVGAELLVRWNHPRHGPLPPSAFVPMAERTEAISEMTLYLIRRGLAQLREWPQPGYPLTLSVNVSANDLADARLVAAIIEAHGADRPGLILEVTETDVMRDPDRVAAALPGLREHGIRISVDDFGTGHSSLTNLRRLAPDELKIDRSFVANVLESQSDRAIVGATIRLAHDLGASVTAEGIEDEDTLDWLAGAGCDAAQGFCIAPPMPPAEFVERLSEQAGAADQASARP